MVGCGLEDGFPTSYFCYYNPKKDYQFKRWGGGLVRLGLFPKCNLLSDLMASLRYMREKNIFTIGMKVLSITAEVSNPAPTMKNFIE